MSQAESISSNSQINYNSSNIHYNNQKSLSNLYHPNNNTNSKNQLISSSPSSNNLSKLKIDLIKKNNLKTIFQTLMVLPSNRTIADLNTLARILMTITPIKQMKDFSAIYCICKSMYLSKFKQKDFIFQKKDQSQSLYIVLNGKIGLYKRCQDQFQSDEVIFMNLGSCFGKIYKWKQKLIPLALQETLLAVLPQKQYCKIPMYLGIQKQMIVKQLKNAGIFPKINGMIKKFSMSNSDERQYNEKTQNITNTDVFQASQHCSLIRIPHGAYLIQQGQTPKGIFYILKGMVKKVTQVKNNPSSNLIHHGIYDNQQLKASSLKKEKTVTQSDTNKENYQKQSALSEENSYNQKQSQVRGQGKFIQQKDLNSDLNSLKKSMIKLQSINMNANKNTNANTNININSNSFSTISRSLHVHRYSAGDYFPQNNLSQPINFSFITQCPSQIIVVPKKSLKKVGFISTMKKIDQQKQLNDKYFVDTLKKQDNWKVYKDMLMEQILDQIKLKKQRKKKM